MADAMPAIEADPLRDPYTFFTFPPKGSSMEAEAVLQSVYREFLGRYPQPLEEPQREGVGIRAIPD